MTGSSARASLAARTLAVGATAAALLAGCGSSAAHYGAVGNLGTLSGEVRLGPLASIAARWTVPRIASSSSAGRAGTWVGAQVSLGPDSAFIQVGTNEELGSPASPSQYYTFWSDAAHGFHPVYLFPVQPGDVIAASLRRRGGRWLVTIRDEDSGSQRRFWTPQDGRGHFVMAEWLQEDITTDQGQRPFPYPQLAPVRFWALRVNGSVPAANTLLSQWMSAGRSYVGPTAVARNSFEVGTRLLSAVGLRYLKAATAEDQGVNQLTERFGLVGVRTPMRAMRAFDHRLASVLAGFNTRLTALRWPRQIAGLIHRMVALDVRQIRLLRAGPGPTRSDRVSFERASRAFGDMGTLLGDRVRRALGLPEITPERW
ncbi:MAG: G1 family glutamic endopeptidase [Solirubrobacteraceae bacterium]